MMVGSGFVFCCDDVVTGVGLFVAGVGVGTMLFGAACVDVLTVFVSTVFSLKQPAPINVKEIKREGRMAFFIKENRLIVSCHRERCLANKLTSL